MNDHPNALPVGYRLGEYEIQTVLGSGGFGITYKAHDHNLDKAVAIKEYLPSDFSVRVGAIVKPKSSASKDDYAWGLERFIDEARTLARFDHPHINKVHRYFQDNGTAYLVLEYVDGDMLSALLKSKGRFNEAGVRRMLDELLDGLNAVHKAGYIHRDVKPANIIFRRDGSAVLLDFGAARQAIGQRSQMLTSILTPGYAPVEQYLNTVDAMGAWTDLYSLGMVAYRCLVGGDESVLIDAPSRAHFAKRGEMDKDMPLAVKIGKGKYSASLLSAIDWAMKVDEGDRPQSVAEMREGLVEGARIPKSTSALTRQPATFVLALKMFFSAVKQATNALRAGLVKRTDVTVNKVLALYRVIRPVVSVAFIVIREVVSLVFVMLIAISLFMFGVWVLATVVLEHLDTTQEKLAVLGAIIGLLALTFIVRKRKANAKNKAAHIKKIEPEASEQSAFRELVGRDASPSGIDADSDTTDLHIAVSNGWAHLTKWLVGNGANIYAQIKSDDKEMGDALRKFLHLTDGWHRRGQYPLHFALADSEVAAAKVLIESGASVNATDINGLISLHTAASKNYSKMIQFLLANGADVNAKTKSGWTPLHYAAWNNSDESAKLLVADGADVNAKTNDSATPLHWAAYGNAVDAAKLLIAEGADVNARDNGGYTPLHTAAFRYASSTTRVLLANGADVNAKNNDGYTPLHFVATSDNAVDKAKLLLANGADVNAKTIHYATPLHCAASSDAVDAAKLLLANGANVRAKTRSGETPLGRAKEKGHTKLINLLQQSN